MLALGTLLTVLDSVAKGVENFGATIGVVGNEGGTIAKAAADNRDLLAALDDYTVQNDLTPIFAVRASLIRGTNLYPALQGAMLARALDKHYGEAGNGSLNRFLANNDARVHPNLRLIGMQFDSRNVFSPVVVDPVAQYVGSGAGTGTYTAGSDISTVDFGPSKMEVVVTLMGALARTLNLTMKKFDGSTEIKAVVVTGNAPLNTTFAIGGASDRYVGVTGITSIGGQANDSLRVRSIVERVIVL